MQKIYKTESKIGIFIDKCALYSQKLGTEKLLLNLYANYIGNSASFCDINIYRTSRVHKFSFHYKLYYLAACFDIM